MSSPIYRTFNAIYEEFFGKMTLLMPDQDKVSDLHAAFLLLKKANNRAPLEMFIKSIYPYTIKILEKNEDFFLSNDELNEIAVDNSSFVSKSGLHDKWGSFTDATKENIWTYITGLTKLAFKSYGISNINKCVSSKPESEENILNYLENYQK